MKRRTLTDYIEDEVPGLTHQQLSQATKLTYGQIYKLYANNRLLLKLILAGYKSEIGQ